MRAVGADHLAVELPAGDHLAAAVADLQSDRGGERQNPADAQRVQERDAALDGEPVVRGAEFLAVQAGELLEPGWLDAAGRDGLGDDTLVLGPAEELDTGMRSPERPHPGPAVAPARCPQQA